MQGPLRKMQTQLGRTVRYDLVLGEQVMPLNALVGKPVKLQHTGKIVCVNCGRTTRKSFNQGYCYPCFSTLAQCDLCIMKPETCHYGKGTCREPAWGETFCMQPHYVYLANSSGVKVGITRQNQIPARWIDQGAVQALPIFKAQTRHISGLIEVVIAKHISDKTSWQQMLKNNVEAIDLIAKRNELMEICNQELADIIGQFGKNAFGYVQDMPVIDIHYPVNRYPEKIKSFNLDTNPVVYGILEGIKGQYLLLDTGVINLRKYSGYELEFCARDQADELLLTNG